VHPLARCTSRGATCVPNGYERAASPGAAAASASVKLPTARALHASASAPTAGATLSAPRARRRGERVRRTNGGERGRFVCYSVLGLVQNDAHARALGGMASERSIGDTGDAFSFEAFASSHRSSPPSKRRRTRSHQPRAHAHHQAPSDDPGSLASPNERMHRLQQRTAASATARDATLHSNGSEIADAVRELNSCDAARVLPAAGFLCNMTAESAAGRSAASDALADSGALCAARSLPPDDACFACVALLAALLANDDVASRSAHASLELAADMWSNQLSESSIASAYAALLAGSAIRAYSSLEAELSSLFGIDGAFKATEAVSRLRQFQSAIECNEAAERVHAIEVSLQEAAKRCTQAEEQHTTGTRHRSER